MNVPRATGESQGAEKSLANPRPSRKVAAHLHAAQPLPDGQEGLLGCEVIHNNHAVGLPEELLSYTAISAMGEPASGAYLPWEPWPETWVCSPSPLLPSRVPQLQSHPCVVHSDGLHSVVDACKMKQACENCLGHGYPHFQVRRWCLPVWNHGGQSSLSSTCGEVWKNGPSTTQGS